jgi:pSer/pThr/pTyr-binding forkhead associated (FHA) protein
MGALFCSKCGNQLIYPENSNTNVIETTLVSNYDANGVPSFPPPPADVSDSIVAILFLNSEEVLHLGGRNVYTFGRSTKGQTIIPDIDLNPYDAYEAGVSRLHANINITGQEVTIQDLGSANGTHLNEKRLPSHIEHPLNHGDILVLGQLRIQVLIKE